MIRHIDDSLFDTPLSVFTGAVELPSSGEKETNKKSPIDAKMPGTPNSRNKQKRHQRHQSHQLATTATFKSNSPFYDQEKEAQIRQVSPILPVSLFDELELSCSRKWTVSEADENRFLYTLGSLLIQF
jgi:hypothetical protein